MRFAAKVLGVNTPGILLTGGYFAFCWWYFGHKGQLEHLQQGPLGIFIAGNMWRNLAYFASVYLVANCVLAALAVIGGAGGGGFTKLAIIFNILVLPILTLLYLSRIGWTAQEIGLVAEKLQFLQFCKLVSVLELGGGVTIGFLVSGRVFGFGGGGGSA